MATTAWLLECIKLSNNHSLVVYWNFCLTEFGKLYTFMRVR